MTTSGLQQFLYSQLASNKCVPFENEYATQLSLLNQPGLKDKIVTWLWKYEFFETNKPSSKSDDHREKGNILFRKNKRLNALEASLCYTKAIFSAPEGSKALSLAHANRSAALLEFGFFKAAYEDCQCAVDCGYPRENLQKVICRQASCAVKLKNYDKLSGCLEKLRTMTLSEPFAKEVALFEKELVRLDTNNMKIEAGSSGASILNQNILKHPQKGRYMTASKNIGKDEEILVEKVFSFIPIGKFIVCSGCASQNIIPFPCYKCSKVVYCSMKCKNDNEMVHSFECYAYKIGLLNEVGVTHCALNMLLNGLPAIISKLNDCKSATEIWNKIELLAKTEEKGYALVLSLVTNLKSTEFSYVESIALNATTITYYLKEFTLFFELFNDSNCTPFDWEVIVSALLLKHSAQTIVNANTNLTLIFSDKPYEVALLSDIWSKPHRLRNGLLHRFAEVTAVYAGIFPYLSLCNHSCAPSLSTRFDGNRVIAIARNNLVQGEEIYNGYTSDYRAETTFERQVHLKEIYNFKCECNQCTKGTDDDLLKFHKYHCENSECGSIFSPPITNLYWWQDDSVKFLTCPACETKLNVEFYYNFQKFSSEPKKISKMLQMFELSKHLLIGFNQLRKDMAMIVVEMFFEFWQSGFSFSHAEFKGIGEVLVYVLDFTEQKNDLELMYAATSTFALDIMAQGYNIGINVQKIRKAFSFLSVEMRIIFENYIDDHIEEMRI